MQPVNEKHYRGGGGTAICYVPLTPELKILDLGCGMGSTRASIKKRQDATVFGITASQAEHDVATTILDDCRVFNLENGLPDYCGQKFDVIVMSHFLEHICYPERLLKDLPKVLESDGVIIVVLPNIMHYSSRLKLMRGIFEYSDNGMYDYTHMRWYTYKSAESLFAYNGFRTRLKDVHVCLPFGRITNRIPSEIVKNWIAEGLKKGIERIFWR